MIKSPNGVILTDQWDEDVFEKDIKTVMTVDYDDLDSFKPVYIEIKDVGSNEEVVGSICIALSNVQAILLYNALLSMVTTNK